MKKMYRYLPLLLLAACSKNDMAKPTAGPTEGSYNARIHYNYYWVSNTSDHGESDSNYVASLQITDPGTGPITVVFPDPYGNNKSVDLHLDQNTADSLIFSNSSTYPPYDGYNTQLRFGKTTRHFTFSYTQKYRVTSWNTITYTIEGQP